MNESGKVDRRAVLRTLAAMPAAAAGVAAWPDAAAAAPAPPGVRYTNPLVRQRADPHIVWHTDGHYHFTATVPEYDRIILRRATTIQGLSSAPEKVIWVKHATGDMAAHIWAPEIHFIDGRWYVYFAAGSSDDVWRIRMYVLQSSGADAFASTWTERGRLATPWDTFSLDASTFVHNGTRYLVWAQKPPGSDVNSGLYIARMSSPWTITGTPTLLSTPTLPWETIGYKVNEGPAVLVRNGRVFMTYSASATDANYCMGLLTASASSDPLNAASWSKSPDPVFTSNDATSQYGPGHNSFTVAEDGKSDVLVYHDRDYRDISGDPLDDPNRRTRIQKLYWNADGTPNFGIPVSDGVTPYRLSSYSSPGLYVRHYGFRVRLDADVAELADSQFRIVPGLTGDGTVSLESANYPGHYLRHRDFEMWVERDDATTLFEADASFRRRPGLADPAGISLESVNFAGRHVRRRSSLLYLEAADSTAARGDATFYLE
ncbi:family 43 glycosylhydrolase [Actinomadura sp. 3N407]|uniref:family 43 glycosylhydrolase n=1 Tax=Actinomadura sp. 3N407 TaxID=3457423 RepID=UPI003FCE8FBA